MWVPLSLNSGTGSSEYSYPYNLQQKKKKEKEKTWEKPWKSNSVSFCSRLSNFDLNIHWTLSGLIMCIGYVTHKNFSIILIVVRYS